MDREPFNIFDLMWQHPATQKGKVAKVTPENSGPLPNKKKRKAGNKKAAESRRRNRGK